MDLGRSEPRRQSDGAADATEEQLLRYAGFCHAALSLPLSVAAMLHGTHMAAFIVFAYRRAEHAVRCAPGLLPPPSSMAQRSPATSEGRGGGRRAPARGGRCGRVQGADARRACR